MSDLILDLRTENAKLLDRVAALEAVLMTESERRDLLSKDHYRDQIRSLTAEGALKDKALADARDAIAALPVGALGEASDGPFLWPIRDELIDKITKAIGAASDSQECPECEGRGFTRFNAYGAGEPQATSDFPCENCNETGYIDTAASSQERDDA